MWNDITTFAIGIVCGVCVGVVGITYGPKFDNGYEFICSFDRIGGLYATTRSELTKDSNLIFVVGPADREHAFSRSQLLVCEVME